MHRFRPQRLAALFGLISLGSCLCGCDLRVTRDRPTFEQLDPFEQDAVEIVLEELRAFNAQVTEHTPFDIGTIIDRERINVSFEGIIFAANLGDETVHVAVWDNLDAGQKELIRTWFQAPDLAAAQEIYEQFFYRYMAVSQGAKQYMYEALGVAWVFGNRSLFNVERDSARLAFAHYADVDPSRAMWTFLSGACAPLLLQYGAQYGPTFSRSYLNEHFRELVGDGKKPTGYMYYVCRWIEMATESAADIAFELDWIQRLDPA